MKACKEVRNQLKDRSFEEISAENHTHFKYGVFKVLVYKAAISCEKSTRWLEEKWVKDEPPVSK